MTPKETADRLALRDLVTSYAEKADARDYEGYGNLFTPNAVFTGYAPGAAEPFVRVAGGEAIGQMLHANDAFAQTFHSVDNHRCDINGDTATGVTYCVARHYREANGTAEVIITPLRYHDTYVRTADVWRFSARAIHFTWVEKATADLAELATWTGQAPTTPE